MAMIVLDTIGSFSFRGYGTTVFFFHHEASGADAVGVGDHGVGDAGVGSNFVYLIMQVWSHGSVGRTSSALTAIGEVQNNLQITCNVAN